MTKAAYQMVIDHAAGMHVGVDGHRAEELEAAFLEVFAIGDGQVGRGGDLGAILAVGLKGLTADEIPLVFGK